MSDRTKVEREERLRREERERLEEICSELEERMKASLEQFIGAYILPRQTHQQVADALKALFVDFERQVGPFCPTTKYVVYSRPESFERREILIARQDEVFDLKLLGEQLEIHETFEGPDFDALSRRHL